MVERPIKPIHWVGSSKKDLLALPDDVIDVFGYGLYLAQIGGKHPQAKPLHGFGSAGVLEIVEDQRGGTTGRFTRWKSRMLFRIARVSEEVQAWYCNAQTRSGLNPCST